MIRPYKESDFSSLKNIIFAILKDSFWEQYFPLGWNEEKIKQEFIDLLFEKYEDSLFLVFEDQEEVIGAIIGHSLFDLVSHEVPHLQDKFEKNLFYQRNLIVHPLYQRKGIAKKLSSALEDYARKKKYFGIVTRTPPLNQKGKALFNSLGYTELFTDHSLERTYFSLVF